MVQRRYISEEGLTHLAGYQYHGIDNSILARLFLNDFWNFVLTRSQVSFVPLWVAPNVITLSGFLLILANYAAIAWLCPSLTGCNFPSWVSGPQHSIHKLDNIDGKQARRTKSSSPLGELFDHGCDSMFVTIAGIALPAAFGASPWFGFIMLHVGYLAFYYAHWEEYHTGILILGPLANPTEMQILMCIVLLFTSYVGTDFWSLSLGSVLPEAISGLLPPVVANALLNEGLVGVVFCIVFALLFWSAQEVLRVASKRNISAVDACGPLVPLFINLAASLAWFYYSPAKLLQNHSLGAYTFYGVIVSYLLIKLILARIIKIEFPNWDPILLLPIIGAYYAVFLKHVSFFTEVQLFALLTAVAVFMHLHLTVGIMRELTSYLKIRAFKIPYPSK